MPMTVRVSPARSEVVVSEIECTIDSAELNYFVCRFPYDNLILEESAGSFDRFAAEVMPRFT